jgi:glycosyltransferase involved in cell wall biosynthesis
MEALTPARRRGSVLAVAHQFALGFGGVPESILSLGRELGKSNVRLDVLSKDGIAVDVGTLSALPARGCRLSVTELRGLDVAQYRAVFVAGAWNPVACWLAVQAKRRHVRLVYAPKGNLAFAEFKRVRDLKKFPYLATLELALLLMSDRIIYSSRLEQANSVLASVFRRKSAVLPEIFVGPSQQAPQPRRDGSIRFGFMAEIAPRKGLAELVQAFVAWQTTSQSDGLPDAELHVAGEPRPGSERYYRDVRAVADAAPQPQRIVWRGPLRGRAREDFYQEIDFFVCPTRFESFGLTPLEALWHGTPVMVTRNLGVLEFISDPQSMISLGGGSGEEIVTALSLAMTARDASVAAAKQWRSRVCPSLASDKLASAFVQEFGFLDPTTGCLRA